MRDVGRVVAMAPDAAEAEQTRADLAFRGIHAEVLHARPGTMPAIMWRMGLSDRYDDDPTSTRDLGSVLVLRLRPDDDHRAFGMLGALLTHRAQHQTLEAATPPRADHEQIRIS
jgi:hypothetical protein